MQYCVLYHYTNVVVLTFGAIDYFGGVVEQNEVSIKNQTLWIVRVFTCLYAHSFPSFVLYNTTKEFREPATAPLKRNTERNKNQKQQETQNHVVCF